MCIRDSLSMSETWNVSIEIEVGLPEFTWKILVS